MINSPRALVFNSDPIGHPSRSPTVRAAWESEGNIGGGRSAWGTDIYPKRAPQVGIVLGLSPTGRFVVALKFRSVSVYGAAPSVLGECSVPFS